MVIAQSRHLRLIFCTPLTSVTSHSERTNYSERKLQMKKAHCGICCIETAWDNGKVTAIPALRTLAALKEVGYVSKSISTADQFAKTLDAWMELDTGFDILYVSSHGLPGGIALNENIPFKRNIRLPQIADIFEDWDCENDRCIVHFGSCSTLSASSQEINDFFKRTEFAAVSGYRRDVDWTKSFAFDLLYLDYTIANAPQRLSPDYMDSVRFDLREHSWYGLGSSLGFDIQTNPH